MRVPQVPAVATWLLKHFGSSPKNGAIVGDLAEHFAQGRSRSWYWRQVLVTIVESMWTEIRTYPSFAIRTFVVGWAMLLIYTALGRTVTIIVYSSPYELTTPFTKLLWHEAYFHPKILGFAVFAITNIGMAGTGWILARLCRPNLKAVLLAFAASVFAIVFLWVGYLEVHPNPLQSSHYLLYQYGLCSVLAANLTGLLCLLGGAGFWRTGSDH